MKTGSNQDEVIDRGRRTAPDHSDPGRRDSREYHAAVEKIKSLPAGVGVALMGVGVAGVVLPGPIGAPFLLAGGLVLAPQYFDKLNRYLHQQFPTIHHVSMEAIGRFVDDLEKRYPNETS